MISLRSAKAYLTTSLLLLSQVTLAQSTLAASAQLDPEQAEFCTQVIEAYRQLYYSEHPSYFDDVKEFKRQQQALGPINQYRTQIAGELARFYNEFAQKIPKDHLKNLTDSTQLRESVVTKVIEHNQVSGLVECASSDQEPQASHSQGFSCRPKTWYGHLVTKRPVRERFIEVRDAEALPDDVAGSVMIHACHIERAPHAPVRICLERSFADVIQGHPLTQEDLLSQPGTLKTVELSDPEAGLDRYILSRLEGSEHCKYEPKALGSGGSPQAVSNRTHSKKDASQNYTTVVNPAFPPPAQGAGHAQ